MRKYESVTGHIRCSIRRTRLLGGTLSTGSIAVHTARRWHAAARLQACHIVGPSGPTTCRAFRLDYKSGLQAGLTQVLAPTVVVVIDAAVAVDAHAPQAF